MNAGYDSDFYDWTRRQAALLRARRFAELDTEHLAEEIESMGRSERNQLTRRLELLLVQLLKWQYQPALRGRSWELTIAEQRRRIARLLRNDPSLEPLLPALLADAYEDARYAAMQETGLALTSFPAACPYSVERSLDPQFLPED